MRACVRSVAHMLSDPRELCLLGPSWRFHTLIKACAMHARTPLGLIITFSLACNPLQKCFRRPSQPGDDRRVSRKGEATVSVASCERAEPRALGATILQSRRRRAKTTCQCSKTGAKTPPHRLLYHTSRDKPYLVALVVIECLALHGPTQKCISS